MYTTELVLRQLANLAKVILKKGWVVMSHHVYIIKTTQLFRSTDMIDPYEQDQKFLAKHLINRMLSNEKNNILIM